MARKTRAEIRDEKEKRFRQDDKVAWRVYVTGLAKLSDPRAAERFANAGPDNGDPGGRYYHNLGCYLHANTLDDPSVEELEELLKFGHRAEAEGHRPALPAAYVERQLLELRARPRD